MKYQARISWWPLGIIMLAGCADREAQSIARQTLEATNKRIPTVRVVLPKPDLIERTVTGTGFLVSDDELTVSSELPGRLEAVLVKEGDQVKAGQVIAYLDASSLRTQRQQAQDQTRIADAQLKLSNHNAELSPARTIAQMRAAEEEVQVAQAEVRRLRAGARPEELASARAEVSSVEATLEQADKDLRRYRVLVEVGGIAQVTVDASVAQRKVAEANLRKATESVRLLLSGPRREEVEAATARVRQAQQNLAAAKASVRLESTQLDQVAISEAQLRAASTGVQAVDDSLRRTAIKSSIAGRVFGRALKAGSTVNPGEAIAQIVGTRRSLMEVDFPATQIGSIRVGQSASVELEGGQSCQGTVSVISPKAERAGRVYRVKIFLPSISNVPIGSFGRVKIRLSAQTGLSVPIAALRDEQGKQSVMVIKNGRTGPQPVRVLARSGQRAIVTGLGADQRVVVSGPENLAPSVEVRIEGADK